MEGGALYSFALVVRKRQEIPEGFLDRVSLSHPGPGSSDEPTEAG